MHTKHMFDREKLKINNWGGGGEGWSVRCFMSTPQKLKLLKLRNKIVPNTSNLRDLTVNTLVQLLSKIFIDSDFCHNYLHTLFLFECL